MTDWEPGLTLGDTARGLVAAAATKAVLDTRTNPSPHAQDLSTQAARAGFVAGVREMLQAAEFFNQEDLYAPEEFFEALEITAEAYLEATETENNE